VFQKGFVEFFCEAEMVEVVESKIERAGGWVDYFAANVDVSALRTGLG
jgi:hypothetical protein